MMIPSITPISQIIQRLIFGRSDPTALEKSTLPRFLFGMVFQGIWWAGYLLVPFVLAKSLAASGELITLSVTMDTGGMLLALYWGHLLTRGNRRLLILLGGIGGRMILLLSFLVNSAEMFVLLLAAVYFFGSLVYPAQNGILQANFRPQLQGRIWGVGTSIQNILAVTTSLIVGRTLDHDPGFYKAVYATIGLFGFIYLWILSSLCQPDHAVPGFADEEPSSGVRRQGSSDLDLGRLVHRLLCPFAEALATYRRDHGYLWYEANFMAYGLAFLMLYTMLPILLAERLSLAYEQISTARIVIAQLGVAMLAPLMGWMSDRYHPARLCQLAFGIMAIFPLGLIYAHNATTTQPERIVYLVFVIYAVGMAGVNIGWNVGSISFAPAGLGSHYQGIHVAMVGIRGLLGPLLGFTVYRFFGMERVFLLACCLLVSSSLSSAALARWVRTKHSRL